MNANKREVLRRKILKTENAISEPQAGGSVRIEPTVKTKLRTKEVMTGWKSNIKE